MRAFFLFALFSGSIICGMASVLCAIAGRWNTAFFMLACTAMLWTAFQQERG